MLPILFQFQVNLFQINLKQFFFECFRSFIISLYIAIVRSIYVFMNNIIYFGYNVTYISHWS